MCDPVSLAMLRLHGDRRRRHDRQLHGPDERPEEAGSGGPQLAAGTEEGPRHGAGAAGAAAPEGREVARRGRRAALRRGSGQAAGRGGGAPDHLPAGRRTSRRRRRRRRRSGRRRRAVRARPGGRPTSAADLAARRSTTATKDARAAHGGAGQGLVLRRELRRPRHHQQGDPRRSPAAASTWPTNCGAARSAPGAPRRPSTRCRSATPTRWPACSRRRCRSARRGSATPSVLAAPEQGLRHCRPAGVDWRRLERAGAPTQTGKSYAWTGRIF